MSFPVLGTAPMKILQTLQTTMQDVMEKTDNFSIMFRVIVLPVSLRETTEAMKKMHFTNRRILLGGGGRNKEMFV